MPKSRKTTRTKSMTKALNIATFAKKRSASVTKGPAGGKKKRYNTTKPSPPARKQSARPSDGRRIGTPITRPNIYFFVYVFRKGDAPVSGDFALEANSTFHFREYAESKMATPLSVRVWNSIQEITNLQYPNADSVRDYASNSDYEIRVVDLSNLQDNDADQIEQRRLELETQGYGRALCWRLFCATVRSQA
jgi:hypothetical protein